LIFLPHLKRAEEIIAARIKSLAASPSAFPAIDFEKALVWCQQKTGKELAPSQRDALKLALSSRVLVITGGPGVGKTTLINAVLLILRAKKVRPCYVRPQAGRPSAFSRRPALRPKQSTACSKSSPPRAGLGEMRPIL